MEGILKRTAGTEVKGNSRALLFGEGTGENRCAQASRSAKGGYWEHVSCPFHLTKIVNFQLLGSGDCALPQEEIRAFRVLSRCEHPWPWH